MYPSEKARKLNIPGIPLVRGPWFGDFRKALEEANAKYANEPYIAAFFDPTVIIPSQCVEELKNIPDTQISATGNMATRFSTSLAESGDLSKELAASVKYDLPRAVDDFFPDLQEEIQDAADRSLPSSETWERAEVQQDLVQIVGRVIGRIMVGAPLNRNSAWLNASIDHAIAVIMFSFWLRQFPDLLRPYIAPFMPYKRRLERSKRVIAASVRPLIAQHSSRKTGIQAPPESGRLVRWLLERYEPKESPLVSSHIVKDHNTLCFAAIHGPNFLLVQALIDLASYPQYVTPLRKEIDRELTSAPFEEWTRETVERLEFLDAFCKESSRTNPQSVYIEDPGSFYPERWMRDRSNPHPDANFKFGSATLDSLTFGLGRHACPGRSLGTAMVKSILAYIVSRWDVRLGGGQKGRPDNIHMDFQAMPPVPPLGNVHLEFKMRSG
ncbi:hypothetical protein Daus18300_010628 [Diaporthe australafricana]|uniref:Cytochrome P450 n=1 Tax=Diaporthe australafricana TaxID=127596 RepID=A0ABR3WAB3_9PEZI